MTLVSKIKAGLKMVPMLALIVWGVVTLGFGVVWQAGLTVFCLAAFLLMVWGFEEWTETNLRGE